MHQGLQIHKFACSDLLSIVFFGGVVEVALDCAMCCLPFAVLLLQPVVFRTPLFEYV